MIHLSRELCQRGTSYELVDNHIRVSRDFSETKKITGQKNLEDNYECTIKKVKGEFEFFDLKNKNSEVWEDVDRFIWEFNLPKGMKKDILKLEES
jgi:hypothetical protein